MLPLTGRVNETKKRRFSVRVTKTQGKNNQVLKLNKVSICIIHKAKGNTLVWYNIRERQIISITRIIILLY